MSLRSLFYQDAFLDLVREFAVAAPALMVQHRATTELALEVERINLEQALEGRFTVGVVGQMRAGKSTLLNALLERDLAVVGVNETTATTNCFRYGPPEQHHTFRVHWRDGSTCAELARGGRFPRREPLAQRGACPPSRRLNARRSEPSRAHDR